MFGVGQYNIRQFNIGMTQEEDIVHRVSGALNLRQLTGIGQNIHDTVFGAEQVDMRLIGAAAVLSAARGALDVRQAIRGLVQYRAQGAGHLAVEHASTLGGDFYPAARGSLDTAWRGALGANLFHRLAADAAIEGYQELYVDIHGPATAGFLTWWSQVSTISLDTYSAVLNVNIPPGGVLIIDSNTYNVLLNSANAIHNHSGDWLMLSRDTYDVTFRPMTGAASMAVEILYEERWL